MGGLGNQLFQYAAGRALAYRRTAELALDRSWYRSDPRFYLPYQLDKLGVQAREVPAAGLYPVTEQQEWVYDPAVLDAIDGSCLRGYWQSEKYFAEIADYLRQELAVPGPPVPRSCSVHIRRGTAEFVADPSLNRQGADYYEQAVALVKKHAEVEHVFVFTDDRDWFRSSGLPMSWHLASPADGLTDFARMSRCEHHVICNSSFSWWAAWLDPNPDKIVVAPSGASAFVMPDFIPDSWETIECGR